VPLKSDIHGEVTCQPAGLSCLSICERRVLFRVWVNLFITTHSISSCQGTSRPCVNDRLNERMILSACV
jgi:hypothetical protein